MRTRIQSPRTHIKTRQVWQPPVTSTLRRHGAVPQISQLARPGRICEHLDQLQVGLDKVKCDWGRHPPSTLGLHTWTCTCTCTHAPTCVWMCLYTNKHTTHIHMQRLFEGRKEKWTNKVTLFKCAHGYLFIRCRCSWERVKQVQCAFCSFTLLFHLSSLWWSECPSAFPVLGLNVCATTPSFSDCF